MGNQFYMMPNDNKSILIVEDEDAVRDSLCMVLSEEGYHCKGVPDGPSATSALAEQTYDLMILDCRLSRMNGIALLKEIRKTDPDIDVILTTSYAEWKDIAKASQLGISRFMLKPVDFDELLETIAEVLVL